VGYWSYLEHSLWSRVFRFKNKLDMHKESVVAYHYILIIAKKIYN